MTDNIFCLLEVCHPITVYMRAVFLFAPGNVRLERFNGGHMTGPYRIVVVTVPPPLISPLIPLCRVTSLFFFINHTAFNGKRGENNRLTDSSIDS